MKLKTSYTELMGFWSSSIVRTLKNHKIKTRRLGNWICFRPQVRGAPTLLGPLERANLNHWTQESRCLPPSPEDGNRSSFRNVVFLSSNSLESGRWTKSEKPINSVCYTPSSEPYGIYLKIS
jgi:hypothetical protein